MCWRPLEILSAVFQVGASPLDMSTGHLLLSYVKGYVWEQIKALYHSTLSELQAVCEDLFKFRVILTVLSSAIEGS
jgi:hypothetical protein